MAVDPKVQSAVDRAKPMQFSHVKYLTRALLFHLYFVPSLLLLFPIYILRAVLKIGSPCHKDWTVMQVVEVIIARRGLRNMVRFGMQPMPPRENGLREKDNLLGSFLSMLNLTGPGGLVVEPTAVTDEITEFSREGRLDTDWFDPPPLDALKGILSIKTGDNLVTDSALYHGPALVDPMWAKTRVKGFWFMHKHTHSPTPGPSGSQKRPVLLYFHGGAGVTFAAGDLFMGQNLIRPMSKKLAMDVFSVDYTLAPLAPFPVQIVQALAGYLHLVTKYGYHPSQIFVGGDSFGSWMTLQLDHYLRTDGRHVSKALTHKAPTQSGIPALLLLSPWICAFDNDTASRKVVAAKHDMLVFEFGLWGLDAMKVGAKHYDRCPIPLASPWLSPYCYPKEDLARLPPSFMMLGGLEALYDEDALYVDKVRAAGGTMELYVEELGVHDFGTLAMFKPRFTVACQAMHEWLRKSGMLAK